MTTKPLFTEAAISATQRIREQDLVNPALLLLAQAERAGRHSLGSAELHTFLEKALVLSPADRAQTPSDDVTRFGRLVRNMTTSHQTLVRMGFARLAKPTLVNPKGGLRLSMKGRAHLFDVCLGMLEAPNYNEITTQEPSLNVQEDVPRALEKRIVLNALLVLAQIQASNGAKPVSTTEWRRAVKAQTVVAPEDAQILAGRKDSKFDQALRNLISNNVLTADRWVRRTEDGLVLTNRGKAHLLGAFLKMLPSPEFDEQVVPTRKRSPSP